MEDHDLLIQIHAYSKEMSEDINEIKRTLFGNGREGLCATVTKHKVYFALIAGAIGIISGFIYLFLDKIF